MASRLSQRIGAYALVVVNSEVLLVRAGARSATPGWWYLPGGGIEFGEDAKETVVRETLEETGLEIDVRELVAVLSDVMDNTRDGVQTHTVRLVYEAIITGGHLRREIGGSSDLPEWHRLDALPMQVIPFVTKALRELGTSNS